MNVQRTTLSGSNSTGHQSSTATRVTTATPASDTQRLTYDVHRSTSLPSSATRASNTVTSAASSASKPTVQSPSSGVYSASTTSCGVNSTVLPTPLPRLPQTSYDCPRSLGPPTSSATKSSTAVTPIIRSSPVKPTAPAASAGVKSTIPATSSSLQQTLLASTDVKSTLTTTSGSAKSTSTFPASDFREKSPVRSTNSALRSTEPRPIVSVSRPVKFTKQMSLYPDLPKDLLQPNRQQTGESRGNVDSINRVRDWQNTSGPDDLESADMPTPSCPYYLLVDSEEEASGADSSSMNTGTENCKRDKDPFGFVSGEEKCRSPSPIGSECSRQSSASGNQQLYRKRNKARKPVRINSHLFITQNLKTLKANYKSLYVFCLQCQPRVLVRLPS